MKVYESSEKGEMVMTKIFRILALLTAASLLLWIAGCGGDDDDDDCAENVAPTVTLSPAGGDVFSNTTITATCSKPVDSLTVSGAAASPTSADNKVFTFTLPEGSATITVDCTDACGDTGSASGTYSVGAPDNTAPDLDGGGCDPKDGADGVDPADVEEIVLKFSEALKAAEVTSFEPDGDIAPELDGDTVVISFLGNFSLGNEQEIVIELDIEDLAGNTASVEYTFTTMAKE
jgi:hypothetical protein